MRWGGKTVNVAREFFSGREMWFFSKRKEGGGMCHSADCKKQEIVSPPIKSLDLLVGVLQSPTIDRLHYLSH